jgi:hypothetical protein
MPIVPPYPESIAVATRSSAVYAYNYCSTHLAHRVRIARVRLERIAALAIFVSELARGVIIRGMS